MYTCNDRMCGAKDCDTCYPGAADYAELNTCKCGDCNWDNRINPHCLKCKTGPWTRGKTIISEHVARRDHKDGTVKCGDKYRKELHRGYFPDGPFTQAVFKTVLERSQQLELV